MNSQFRFNLKISSELDGDLYQAIELLVKGTANRNRVARIKQVLLKSLVFGRAEQLREFSERYGNLRSFLVDPSALGIPVLGSSEGFGEATTEPSVQCETDTDLMMQLSATDVSFDFSG
jgi:hypothetical protein